MAEAKECDRCNSLYKAFDNQLPYAVRSTGFGNKIEGNGDADLCPDCSYDLEDWFDNPGKFKKKKKVRKEWSQEAKDKASERMTERMKKAKQLREKNPDMTKDESLSEAARVLAKEKPKEAESEDSEDFGDEEEEKTEKKGIINYFKCTMCLDKKVDGPNQMCEECEDNFPSKEDLGENEDEDEE